MKIYSIITINASLPGKFQLILYRQDRSIIIRRQVHLDIVCKTIIAIINYCCRKLYSLFLTKIVKTCFEVHEVNVNSDFSDR